ncbi:MAG: hypoxanthine-guanine phosphoribosyltransferase [Gammaproteobacteria bacterium]
MVDLQEVKTMQLNATCLYSETEINIALDRMAQEITKEIKDQNPIVLCVMMGGIIPTANLVTRLNFPVQIDYVHATRYRGEKEGKDLQWLVKPRLPLKDRVVLVVEDVLDGGTTLAEIVRYCKEQGAKAVYTAVAVDKIRKREPGALEKADFTGVETDDVFLIGYGMDYQEYFRNIPGVYAVAE